jgi:hypothetical protein
LVLFYGRLDGWPNVFRKALWKRDGDSRPPLMVVKHGFVSLVWLITAIAGSAGSRGVITCQ